MTCPNCEFTRPQKNGKDRHGKQRWKCPECGSTFGLVNASRIARIGFEVTALRTQVNILQSRVEQLETYHSYAKEAALGFEEPEEIPF